MLQMSTFKRVSHNYIFIIAMWSEQDKEYRCSDQHVSQSVVGKY